MQQNQKNIRTFQNNTALIEIYTDVKMYRFADENIRMQKSTMPSRERKRKELKKIGQSVGQEKICFAKLPKAVS